MISDAHARLSSTPSLLASRRRLYAAAIDALPPALGLRADDPAAIDNPLLRGAVGGALGGRGGPVTTIDIDRPAGETTVDLLGEPVPLVDLADADQVLRPVLTALDAGATGFLTAVHGERFRLAADLVARGAAVARAYAPGLTADLFPHVALLAVLDGRGDPRRVLSASLREFPGLVMLAEPRDELEAAEALLHEAAHARFFDMAIVHDLLPVCADIIEPFAPSWRPGVLWPAEQAFAALHAYAVLAEFRRGLRAAGYRKRPSAASLLDRAGDRVAELGAWIEPLLPVLGRDAGPFVLGVLGRPPAAESPCIVRAAALDRYSAVQVPDGVAVHRVTDLGRTVAACAGEPARLYVLGDESALVLTALIDNLDRNPIQGAVDAYVNEQKVGPRTAELAVSEIMELLAERSLVSLEKGTDS